MDEQELPHWHPTFTANADVTHSIAHARGQLDLLTVELLRGTIDVLLRAGRYNITLDLAELSSIDTAGVKLLLALQHSLATHSGELTIINARPPVWDELERGQVAARPLLSEQGC